MDRNLDGFYLRVKDEEKGCYVNKCFTDLSPKQQREWLEELNPEGLMTITMELAKILKQMGDEFDIVGE